MTIIRNSKQSGFTLLELIVVVAVLGLITSLATDFVINDSNQTRFSMTKKQLKDIRYAIVGDDSRSLNGQPTISGFVADTGRMPSNLRELLVGGGCSDISYYDGSSCSVAGETWTPIDNWNGPYLSGYTTELVTDGGGTNVSVPVFRDAWGTVDSVAVNDMENFGWVFTPDTPNVGDLTIQSLGLDGAVGTISASNSDTFVFEQDYPSTGGSVPPLVSESDYMNGTVTVNHAITNSSGSAETVCLLWSGIVSGNSGPHIVPDGSVEVFPDSFPASIMGFVEFELQKDGDSNCATNDMGSIPITNNRKVVHHSIATVTFTAVIN